MAYHAYDALALGGPRHFVIIRFGDAKGTIGPYIITYVLF